MLPDSTPSLCWSRSRRQLHHKSLDLLVSLSRAMKKRCEAKSRGRHVSNVRLLVQSAQDEFERFLPHAPPAFLLDSRRRGIGAIAARATSIGRSAFPRFSKNFMLANRIRDAIVIQEQEGPQQQDPHTLRRWQEAGLRIATIMPEARHNRSSPRGLRFRHMWYGLLARLGRDRTLGDSRIRAGAFGGLMCR
jgi:hypothetical protein